MSCLHTDWTVTNAVIGLHKCACGVIGHARKSITRSRNGAVYVKVIPYRCTRQVGALGAKRLCGDESVALINGKAYCEACGPKVREVLAVRGALAQ